MAEVDAGLGDLDIGAVDGAEQEFSALRAGHVYVHLVHLLGGPGGPRRVGERGHGTVRTSRITRSLKPSVGRGSKPGQIMRQISLFTASIWRSTRHMSRPRVLAACAGF